MCAFKHFKIGFFILLFVLGKTKFFARVEFMSGFMFKCFKIPFNHQYFLFFFGRSVILKVQNIMAVKPPSIFLLDVH